MKKVRDAIAALETSLEGKNNPLAVEALKALAETVEKQAAPKSKK